MLAVFAFILLVYGSSLFSRRLSANSLAIPQSFAMAVITLGLIAPGLASGYTRSRFHGWPPDAPEFEVPSGAPAA